MKKTILALLGLFIMLGMLASCKVAPFNPKADIRLNGFTDTTNTTIISSQDVVGAGPHSIRASISVLNGVDTNFTEYLVEFYDTTGAAYPFTVRNKIAVQIQGSGSTPASVTGYVPVAVTTTDIVTYKTTNVIAQYNIKTTIFGTDINGNNVQVSGDFIIF